MQASTNPYISFKDVEVRYSEFVAGLRGVSLRIEKGEFVFFVGKTGAGKSTLLKLLTREAGHTKGTVVWNDRDLGLVRERDIPSLRREMGIVPQDFALLPRKRVWENVAYAMRAVGSTKKEIRRRVPEILEQVNIGHRADAFPHQLSGGEQQRVAIGRALINSPQLLLADEPTGNLDPEHSWEIIDLLRQLNSRGTTVLVASHDMLVVERAKARIVRLENGLVMDDSQAIDEPIEEGLFAEEPPEAAHAEEVEVEEPTIDPILPEPTPIEEPRSLGLDEILEEADA